MNLASRLRKVEGHLGSIAAEVARMRNEASKCPHDGESSTSLSCAQPEALAAYLALAPALDEDAILQTLLKCAMHVVGAGGAGLTLLDHKKKRLVFRAAIGDGAQGIIGQEVPLKGSQHGLAFATGEVQSATPLYSDIEKKARARFSNVLVAPLQVAGESIGTISAVNKQGGGHFTAADMEAYKLFADLAAVVVRQRSREQLLRKGLAGARRAAGGLPMAFAPDDAMLLELFDGVARLKQARPAWLPVLKQFIGGMARSLP